MDTMERGTSCREKREQRNRTFDLFHWLPEDSTLLRTHCLLWLLVRCVINPVPGPGYLHWHGKLLKTRFIATLAQVHHCSLPTTISIMPEILTCLCSTKGARVFADLPLATRGQYSSWIKDYASYHGVSSSSSCFCLAFFLLSCVCFVGSSVVFHKQEVNYRPVVETVARNLIHSCSYSWILWE